ncbi:hypothetical protein AGDE_11261 [Angomonas deanei]|uniref:Uncharacterized protein n=1 Tax=Angomonas deanei TaxID=59799 RepID=A0A7G2CML6_9TRYP|nr:hypothetical protein AGDE_11261 [Angomonas deanei]CAD2221080.1 hypothetical protein, conserved [Angomonas deanei]|eukprot:EPY26500.1 hypothetical protein AGDE_11261 [Angomonas deanei]
MWGLAQPALAPSVALLQLLLTDAPGKAAEVGQIADSLFKNETVLRWFNCDELDCEANDISFRYLRQYTTLIDYLLDTTLTAFTEDILLLANFLTVCGVVCRMREVPAALSDAVGTGLQCQDELLYDLCCSFCTIVLKAHEANTTQFGSVWLEAFVKQTDPSRLSVYNTTLDTLGVYWSTKAGCDAVARSTINADWCTERLKGTTSNMTRLPLVRFIHYAATSTCAAAPFCDKALLTEVWKLSRNPEEEVRQCVWAIALGVTASPTLRPLMEQSYASYLCGHFEEDNRVIRQLQLDTARALCAQGNLPDAVKSRLRKFGEKGLYPPSSISVAAPRD